MTASLIFYMTATFAAGYAASYLLCPGLPRAFRLSLSFGLGQGLTSCTAFLWLRTFGGFDYYVAAEVALCLCLLACCVGRRWEKSPAEAGRPGAHVLLTLAFAASVLSALTFLFMAAAARPHGGGDASFVYNLRARMIYRGGDYLSALIPWSHPDYPPLLPLSVVRGWLYVGGESQAVAAALSLAFTFSAAAVLVSGLSALRGRAPAYVAGVLFLCYDAVWKYGWCQMADIPLSFFFVSAVALAAFHLERRDGRALALAGTMAALAAWTKNEGVPFAAWSALLVPVLCERAAVYFLGGAAPVMAVALYFKSLAPPSELTPSAFAFEKAADLRRAAVILREFAVQLFSRPWHGLNVSYLLPVYLLLAGVRLTKAVCFGASLLGLMLATYFWAYLTTPYDLAWHVETSLDRLLLQLWPQFLLTTFLAVKEMRSQFIRNGGAGAAS